MWLPSPIVRFLWGSPVVGDLMYARLDRQRRREPQAETIERFAASAPQGASKPLKWSLRIPVPAGDKGNHWGDLYFARDFAKALSSLGQDVEIHRRNNLWEHDGIEDVSVVIRGLERVNPKPGKINILWIISTPELITNDELDGFDIVFAASNSWSEWVTKKTGIKVLPLLQCTDPKRFNPYASEPDLTKEIIFVGNARKRLRKIVSDFIDAQLPIKIYGKGWTGKVPQSLIGQQFIPNDELPIRYRSSKIVLNDHRPDMRKRGFYSNRLFDAVASGARVLSDDVVGLEQFFERAVMTYADSSELRAICSNENLGSWGTEDQIRDRAVAFGKRHSFESRAQEMIQAVHQLRKY
jgi:hypothetical protein